MIAARLGTRAALHQVGALLNQRVSALVCVGVCVGVCAGTGRVCGAVELAGVGVCMSVGGVACGCGCCGRSRALATQRGETKGLFNHLVFVFSAAVV